MFNAAGLRRRSILGIFLALVTAAAFLEPCPAGAQNLFLSNLALRQREGNLLLQFSLRLEDMDMVEKILLDGASLVLECQAELNSKSSWWFDDGISQAVMLSGVKSDSLTREFLVSLPGHERPLKDKKLPEVLEEAWGKVALDLGPMDRLARGKTYNVSLNVKLKYADVPAWLKQTLFFWSWEAIPSASYEMEFTY